MSETFHVGAIDLTIVVAFLILSRVVAIWYSRSGSNDAGGFFLGGRSFVWPLIGFSLFATNMSGASFVGLAGAGYNSGISVFSYEWMAAVILILFVFFILPFYLRSAVFTMPEFLERRFDRRSRYCLSGLLLFLNMFVDCAAALYAGSLVIQTLFPGTPLWVAVFGLALLAAVLSVSGGLRAVVISDTIQATTLIIGGLIIFAAALVAVPSWQAVREQSPEGALSIIQPMGDPALPWPGLITGVLIIGIYFWTSNQMIVQRTLGAKDLDHGRWGALFAGLLKLSVLFIMVLPGVMATVLYPDLSSPDLAFPTLAFDLLPVGARGIVLAALIAAITSSVDSILNSASTMMTMDIIRPLRPNVGDRWLVFWGRVTTVVVTVVAVVWAPQIQNFPTLWQYLQSVLSYVTPPVVAVFLVGLFWSRANAHAAFAAMTLGVLLGVAGFIGIEIFNAASIHFLYAAGLSFAGGVAVMVLVSLATAPPDRAAIADMVWTPAVWRAESQALAGVPAYKNYRVLSLGLLIATAGVVGAFW